MSATAVGKKGGIEEYHLLKDLCFELHESGIEASFDPGMVLEKKTAEEVLTDKSKKMAVIIYCHEEEANRYYSMAEEKGYAVTHNQEDFKELQNLTPYDCLIQTNDLMRGVDYRTKEGKGIKLLIARDSPNRCEYVQALGRVGRYGEPCERFIVPGVQPVNRTQELRLCNQLRNWKPAKTKQQQQQVEKVDAKEPTRVTRSQKAK